MRWPLVWRATLDRVVNASWDANARAALADARAELATTALDTERARYDALAARYHALRLQGADVAAAPPAPRAIDPVTAAINRRAGSRTVRAAMLAQVESDRTMLGLNDEQIIDRIERGVSIAEAGTP